MRESLFGVIAVTLVTCLSPGTHAEEPGRPEDHQGMRGHRPPPPMILALDTDRDGEISASELSNAVDALKELDKNDDGQLDRSELMPKPPRGHGAPGPRREDANYPKPPHGPRGEQAVQTSEIVARWMKLDKDGDGTLTKKELRGRMRGLLSRADTDEDGIVTEEELTEHAEQEFAQSGGRPDGPPDFRGGGPGPRNFGPPPNADRFVAHALEFDANNDGQLDRKELKKMGKALQAGPPRNRG